MQRAQGVRGGRHSGFQGFGVVGTEECRAFGIGTTAVGFRVSFGVQTGKAHMLQGCR